LWLDSFDTPKWVGTSIQELDKIKWQEQDALKDLPNNPLPPF
jgi:hypothetical protein